MPRSYKAGEARNEEDGSRTRALSPAATGPPARTTPSTPDLNREPVFRRRELPFEGGLEAFDEDTGRPQTGQLDNALRQSPRSWTAAGYALVERKRPTPA